MALTASLMKECANSSADLQKDGAPPLLCLYECWFFWKIKKKHSAIVIHSLETVEKNQQVGQRQKLLKSIFIPSAKFEVLYLTSHWIYNVKGWSLPSWIRVAGRKLIVSSIKCLLKIIQTFYKSVRWKTWTSTRCLNKNTLVVLLTPKSFRNSLWETISGYFGVGSRHRTFISVVNC